MRRPWLEVGTSDFVRRRRKQKFTLIFLRMQAHTDTPTQHAVENVSRSHIFAVKSRACRQHHSCTFYILRLEIFFLRALESRIIILPT